MKNITLLALFIVLSLSNKAQLFTEQFNTGIMNLKNSNVSWCDYDNDNDLDILLTGSSDGLSSGAQIVLYKNNGYGQFTAQQTTGLNAFNEARSVWSDFNNDGFMDVLIWGKNTYDQPTTILYQNNAGVDFTAINTPVINISNGDAAFGDYNNDGLKDLIIAGHTDLGKYTKLYTNIGNNQFIEANTFALQGYNSPSVQWVDMNKDGFLDIVLFGGYLTSFGEIQVLENLENGQFEKTMSSGVLLKGDKCRIDIGDIDNDGDLDIIANSRNGLFSSYIYLFENVNNSLVRQNNSNFFFPRVSGGDINFGDYNNDGNIDILISGNSDTIYHSKPYTGIYINDGNGNYSFYQNSGIDSAIFRNSSWVDFDNDGDLDVLLCDGDSLGTTKLFKNNSTTTNTAPSVPTNLSITKSNENYILTWNRATDLEDVDSLISYNFKIGTTANTENVCSSESNPSSGYRRVLREGYQRDTFAIFEPFIQIGACENIFYTVQAIDRNYLSSSFSSAINDTNSLVIQLLDTLIQLGDTISINVVDNSCNTPIYQWAQSSSLLGANTPNPTVFPDVSTKYYVTVTDGNMQQVDSVLVDVQFLIEDTTINMEPLDYANCQWVDLDNDGDLDIIHGGNSTNGWTIKVYQNIYGSFTQVNIPNLSPLENLFIKPIDFNNDGLIDLYIEGRSLINNALEVNIYISNGNFNFTKYANFGLDLTNSTGTSSGDYNNDGREDILVFSNNKTSLYSAASLMNYIEVVDSNYSFPHGSYTVLWADMNNDGFTDIVIGGSIDVGQPQNLSGLFLIENNKGRSFKTKHILPLTLGFTSLATEDIDNDGNIDIIISGNNNGLQSVKVIKNNGNGSYTEGSSIEPAVAGIIKTADYDNDGDNDFIIVGNYETHLFINDGSGRFIEDTGNKINGYKKGAAAWGDYNRDSKLDLLVYGFENNFGKSIRLYHNIAYPFNFPPFKPTGLSFDSASAVIHWAIPLDDHTASNSLSYDIAIKTADTELYTHYPNANVVHGYRTISNQGKIYKNNFYKPNLPYDSSYFVRVQAIDQSFNGSLFSDSIKFTMPPISNLPSDTIIQCNTSMQLFVKIINGDTAGVTYNWSPASTLSNSTINNPIASPLSNTWYKLQITSPNGHSYIDSILVEVGFRIYGDSVNITCGDTVQGQFSMNTNAPNISYSWSPTIGISDSTVLNPLFFSTSNQTYTIFATDSFCNTTKSIAVNIEPLARFVTFTALQTEFDTVPFIVEFTNWTSYMNNLYSFEWDFGDGNTLQDNDNIVYHTYNQSGLFPVSLTAINNTTGCTDSMYYNNYISCAVVGLNSPAITNGHLTTYPNPNNGTFTVKLNINSNNTYRVNLYNVNGQEVLSKMQNGKELYSGFQINAEYLNAGIYIIFISSEKERYFTKIIVE